MSIFTDNVVTIMTSLALLIAFFSLFIGAVYWYVCHKEARESHLIVTGEADSAASAIGHDHRQHGHVM